LRSACRCDFAAVANHISKLCKKTFTPSSDQESFYVFLGRLDEQFPVRVTAHVLSEEIKAFFHVGDDRLFRRELQPSFMQKLLNEEFDLSFQQFFRPAGDNEVISITDEIHRSGFTSERLETFQLRELFS
jgi:hypothetical protein